jgi:hypothetical protein
VTGEAIIFAVCASSARCPWCLRSPAEPCSPHSPTPVMPKAYADGGALVAFATVIGSG